MGNCCSNYENVRVFEDNLKGRPGLEERFSPKIETLEKLIMEQLNTSQRD